MILWTIQPIEVYKLIQEKGVYRCDFEKSDFDEWSLILLNGLLSNSEEEGIKLENEYNSLSEKNKKAFIDKNWERVFEIVNLNNGWTLRGYMIQATFWELRKEDIRSVRFFTSAVTKPDYLT